MTSIRDYRRLGRPIVIVTAGILIALTWIGARSAIQSHHAASQARAEAAVVNEALVFESQVRRQLLAIDQYASCCTIQSADLARYL